MFVQVLTLSISLPYSRSLAWRGIDNSSDGFQREWSYGSTGPGVELRHLEDAHEGNCQGGWNRVEGGGQPLQGRTPLVKD